jgi:hypothetical protein
MHPEVISYTSGTCCNIRTDPYSIVSYKVNVRYACASPMCRFSFSYIEKCAVLARQGKSESARAEEGREAEGNTVDDRGREDCGNLQASSFRA